MTAPLGEPGKSGSCGCIKSLDPFLDVNRRLLSGASSQISAVSTNCLRITGAVISTTFPNLPSGITGQPYFAAALQHTSYNGLTSPGSQYKEQKPVIFDPVFDSNGIVQSVGITQTGLYCYKSTDTYLPNFFTIGVPTDYFSLNEFGFPGPMLGTSTFVYSGFFLGTHININDEANKNKGGPTACKKQVSITSLEITNSGSNYTNSVRIQNNLTDACFTPRYKEETPFEGNVLLDEVGKITGIQIINSGVYCEMEDVVGENCNPAPTFPQKSFSFTGDAGTLGQVIFSLADAPTSSPEATGKGGFFDASGRYCVEVAKPHALRKTPFNGQNIDNVVYSYSDVQTRTATHNIASHKCADNEASIEKITPPYKTGDTIYATKSISDGTDLPAANGNNTSLFFMDENRDARRWEDNCGGGGGGAAVWL